MAITLADFNKIWASKSPLTPYSFSESNYKQGWNFIGSTPPARQMWDFLQKNNDEKMQYLANNYLPLSGGTMTGPIITKFGDFIRLYTDSSYFRVTGATSYSNGSSLMLFGQDEANNGGKWQLRARKNSTSYDLVGSYDGTLKWGNDDIALSKDVLPLSGGTITGSITVPTNFTSSAVKNVGTTGRVTIGGGTAYNTGAYIWLYGKDNDGAGQFAIDANNGSTVKRLNGKPDGTLTWDGNQLGLQGCTNTRVTLTSASSTYTFTFGGEIVTIMAKRGNNYGVYLVDSWGAGAVTVASGGTSPLVISHEANTRTVTIEREASQLAVPVQIIHSDIAW